MGDSDVDYVDIDTVYERLSVEEREIFDLKRIGRTTDEIHKATGYKGAFIRKTVRKIKLLLKE
jgi:hypothetical protein